MKKSNSLGILIGLLFLFLGGGYILKTFGVLSEFTIFFDGWWTLFIIIPCLAGILRKDDSKKTGELIGLGIGILLLLMAQDVIDSGKFWALIVAIVFIAIGIGFLFPSAGKNLERHYSSTNDSVDGIKKDGNPDIIDAQNWKEDGETKAYEGSENGEDVHCKAVFSGRDIRVDNTVLESADLMAAFGGIDLNLKNAMFRKNVVIHVKAVFGGIDILLPPGVRVIVEVNPVFGAVKNHISAPAGYDESTPTVTIQGDCMFGGIEIK